MDGSPAARLGDGQARAWSPDSKWAIAIHSAAFSHDGTQYIRRWNGELHLFDLVGGNPRLVPGSMRGDRPLQISDDGRWLFVLQYEPARLTVHRIDLASGQRQVWKAITIPDPAGVMHVGPQFEPVLITPDGASYVYNYIRVLCDLYLVRGLQ